MSTNALNQLEQQLERSIENVRQIKIIVSDFQPQGQPGLNQVGNRLNTTSIASNKIGSLSVFANIFLYIVQFFQKLQTVVKDLQEIDKLRPLVADIQVPLEVFDYIDQGRNPQLYTKDCMEKAVAKNEEVKGKIDAYRLFKAKLLEELTRVFPKETGCYRAMRGDS